ncbi:CD209 antigen [Pteropus alecto]|uniref:CD209 antigen n=1 Tax=Pteropus alecto TaxID=9402 RepID=L5KC61_PTEAL|nr:CD209 antigen [Pteropus alecto]
MQSDLQEIHQQLTWMNATMAGLCRPCPWDWNFFQGSCYIFSQTRSTWKASVSACKDMSAQLVIINNAEEQDFLQLQTSKGNCLTWMGLSDLKHKGTWHWLDNSPQLLSFMKYWNKGELHSSGEEDRAELRGDGWNDSKCDISKF